MSKVAIELTSVPEEIDEVQRRLTRLELDAQQLKQEDEDHAREQLKQTEAEIGKLGQRLASLQEQWRAERAGLGGVRSVRGQLEQAEQAYRQLEKGITEKQTAGVRPDEAEFRELLDMDKRVKQLQKELDAEAVAREAAPTTEHGKRLLSTEVGPEEIAEVVSRWTGVPVAKLLGGEREKLLHLDEELHKRVIGQDEAVSAVAEAVVRSRAGLSDPNRPIGSFIFLGPTGVGKTELARALAEFLFDDEQALVRIDMSEYMEKHAVSRLIGAPPGYVGYEEGGQLTEAVRRRPYSVVLFDEIEKAHPDVFNALLQILDDGRLTDGQGRTIDFKNVVLILTSNIGSQQIVEFGPSQRHELEARVTEALRAHFKPEFLNRVDDVVIFHQLGREQIDHIVDIQLERVRRLLTERRISLELTPEAKRLLAEKGYDPHYGARPLKRVIQRLVQDPLALRILEGAFSEGAKISADARLSGDALEFRVS